MSHDHTTSERTGEVEPASTSRREGVVSGRPRPSGPPGSGPGEQALPFPNGPLPPAPDGAEPLTVEAGAAGERDGFDARTDSGSFPAVTEAADPVEGSSAVAVADWPIPRPTDADGPVAGPPEPSGAAPTAHDREAATDADVHAATDAATDAAVATDADADVHAADAVVGTDADADVHAAQAVVATDAATDAGAGTDATADRGDGAPPERASTELGEARQAATIIARPPYPPPPPPAPLGSADRHPGALPAPGPAVAAEPVPNAAAGPAPATATRPATEAPAGTRRAAGKLGYLPALDGLRAVAVLLVIGYHLGYSGVAGGYIGVEVFFILSGWLVCALLMGEARAAGRISLGNFWLRRARRLLPAMVVVTLVTLGVATALTPDRVADLRGDAFAALTYHLNWRLILDNQSYFAAADGPSALQHLWSLSIEEQFYLVFPLLAIVLAKRRTGVAVTLVLAAVVASTVLRFAWYDAGTDPSTIYFSTITRAAGLLAGVTLGLFWIPRRLRPRPGFAASRVLDAVALAGLGVVAWYTVSVTEQDRAGFRGAFSLVQVATLLAIAALVVPSRSYVRAALGTLPMRWIGQRSYGIYLIHWPVIVFTSRAPGQQPEGVGKVVLQLLAIGVLSAISFTVIEEPIRRNGLVATVRSARGALQRVLPGRPIATCLAMALTIVVVGVTYSAASDVITAEPPTEDHAQSVVISATPTSAPTTAAPTTTVPPNAGTTAPPAAPTTTAPPAPVYPPTTAIGDSVMVGGADALQQRMGASLLTLNAEVGRQMNDVPGILRSMAEAGQLGQTVVLHLGNNGPFPAEKIDEAFSVIGPDRQVVLVTVFVPRRWEGEVNEALQAAAARHPNARVADWRAVPASTPGLLAGDGYHLNAEGAQRYADVVSQAVGATA